MSYRLSLLDKSPIPPGETAADALAHTVHLARLADALGFHRFWVAEHHASAAYAGASPEVLVAHLLARTQRIRVGSGGVMLQHYSPYKVAETFRVLAALAPGRVDLGVGKAPGGLPASTRALQARHDAARRPDFSEQLSELDAFLGGRLPEGHSLAGTTITPQPPTWPERIVLGTGVDSAEEAAALGWQFCYAGHFDGDPANVARALRAYREKAGRPGLLALHAVVADTAREADSLAAGVHVYRVTLETGQRVNLPSLEAAAEFARQAGGVAYTTAELKPQVLTGTPERVRETLDRLAAQLEIEEFVLDSPIAVFSQRLRSVELLAQAIQRSEAVAA